MEDLEKKKKEPHIPWFSGSISLYVALLAVKFNAPSTWFTGLVTLVFGVNQSEVLREHLDQNVRHVSPIRCTGDLATVLFPPPFEIQMTCAFTWQRPILIKISRHAQPCIKIEGLAVEMHKEQKEYQRIPKEQRRQRQIIPECSSTTRIFYQRCEKLLRFVQNVCVPQGLQPQAVSRASLAGVQDIKGPKWSEGPAGSIRRKISRHHTTFVSCIFNALFWLMS